jgi:selenide,water dikinase
VEDSEPKFGLSVTGLVDPAQVTTKGGARAGDVLVLTKPLGTGVLTTAHKRGALADAQLDEAIGWMETLNDRAARAMVRAGARAATDITGYGLLGHAMEMARASRVTFVIDSAKVPLMGQVLELRVAGHFPGGSAANRSWLENAGAVAWGALEEPLRDVLCDAQTSGGLLISLPEAAAEALVAELDHAWTIGRVVAGTQLLEVS